jgi:hypothetical protein
VREGTLPATVSKSCEMRPTSFEDVRERAIHSERAVKRSQMSNEKD